MYDDDDSDRLLHDDQTVIGGEVWNVNTLYFPRLVCEHDDCERSATVRVSRDNGDGLSVMYLCNECLTVMENAQ